MSVVVLFGQMDGVGATSPTPLSVDQAVMRCRQARQQHRGHFQLIVGSPAVWVQGYFVRVVGNGYQVPGESGILYGRAIKTHGRVERVAPNGGLNIGVPSKRFPQGIPTGTWVAAYGTLRCYAPMGQILFVSSWYHLHR